MNRSETIVMFLMTVSFLIGILVGSGLSNDPPPHLPASQATINILEERLERFEDMEERLEALKEECNADSEQSRLPRKDVILTAAR